LVLVVPRRVGDLFLVLAVLHDDEQVLVLLLAELVHDQGLVFEDYFVAEVDEDLEGFQEVAAFVALEVGLALHHRLHNHLHNQLDLLFIIKQLFIISIQLLNEKMHWNIAIVG
jgi:hypothetical protein